MTLIFFRTKFLKFIFRSDKEGLVSEQHTDVVGSQPDCLSISVNYSRAIFRKASGARGMIVLPENICLWEHPLTKAIPLLDHDTT